MDYRQFLFSQLFMIYCESNQDKITDLELEYDLIFPKIIDHWHRYDVSEYMENENKSEYDCIIDYLKNELP